MKFLRHLYPPLFIVIFLAVVGFTVKNAEPVTLHYYLGMSWSAPLVLVLLICLVIGFACGVLACLGLVVRQRKIASSLRHELTTLHLDQPAKTPAGSPEIY